VNKFPLLNHVPSEFQGLLLDVWWDMDKLHKLKLPKQKILVSELEWQLDLPWWQYDGRYFVLSPLQVLSHSERYSEQYKRTISADLSHPIIVHDNNNRWIILDGVHRLLKAHINKIPEIEIAIFTDNLISKILHD
jgi:hypothetical protein